MARRRVRGRGPDRGRRRRARPAVEDQGDRRDPRRRADRRLHGLRSAVRGPANQTFGTTASAAYNGVLHMVQERHPVQPRLLPADRGRHGAGQLRERQLPGSTVGGNSDTHPTTVDILLRPSRRSRPSSSAPTAVPAAASASAARIPHERGRTPTSTSRASAGAAATATTGTTRSSSRTGTARTRRSRSRRRATRS